MRERFQRLSSFSLWMIRRFGVAESARRPRLVILPRLRIIRRHRHANEQCVPHSNFIEHCVGMASRGRSNWSIELHDFDDIRTALHTLECFDELRQFTDRAVLRNAILTANLAASLPRSPSDSVPLSIQRKTASCSRLVRLRRGARRSRSLCDQPSRC